MGQPQRALHHPAAITVVTLLLIFSCAPLLAQSSTLCYGGDGVYPRHCSDNSQRWFRVQTDRGADTTALTDVYLDGVSGGQFNPNCILWGPRDGGGYGKPRNDYLDGVVQYYPGGRVCVHTIGPFTGFGWWNPRPHDSWCMGNFGPQGAYWFRFTCIYWAQGATQPTIHYLENTYYSEYDDSDTLEWYQSPAAGVDPLAVTPNQLDPDADNGAGDSTYTFRVQYSNTRDTTNPMVNLPPRWGADAPIPGPQAYWVNFDALPEAAPTVADANNIWIYWDYVGQSTYYGYFSWTIPPGNDPWLDRTGNWVAFPDRVGATIEGEYRDYEMLTQRQVLLIVDGNINAPHYMIREDPNDNNFRNGVIYRYTIQPTHYLNLLDNLFQLRYNPPFPNTSTQDTWTPGIQGTPVDNGYASLSVGRHSYEFLATDDWHPPRGVAYVQVGRPGFQMATEYLHPRPATPEITYPVYYTREPVSVRATRPYGYPYDSRTHPDVNPVLTAFPYFPQDANAEGSVAPYQDVGDDPRRVPPIWTEAFNGVSNYTLSPVISPFELAGLGPEGGPEGAIVGGRNFQPTHYTNQDTIRPSYGNIWDANPVDPAAVPFQGGKWTQSTKFTFLINYWRRPSLPPSVIRAMIRKNNRGQSPNAGYTGFTMQQLDPTDTDYSNGAIFRFQISAAQLPGGGGPGDYNYFFTASDGEHTTIFPNRPPRYTDSQTNFTTTDWDPLLPGDWRFGTGIPQADFGVPVDDQGGNDYFTFRVNHPPTLAQNDVTPASGRIGSDFVYKVTYTDTDGQFLNPAPKGDQPYTAGIGIDLFGDPEGQNGVTGVATGRVTYATHPDPADWTKVGARYAPGSLVNAARPYYIRIEEAANPAAVGLTYQITTNDATSITATPIPPALGLGTDPITAASASYRGDRFEILQWFTGTMDKVNPADDDATDGIQYRFSTANLITLGPGTHRYYFLFRDDWGDWVYPDDPNISVEGEAVRFPGSSEFEGPEVLQNHAPYLSNYRYTPKAAGTGKDGTTATGFILTVTYTDLDNDAPQLIRIGVDGTASNPAQTYDLTPVDPKDNVYTDGAVFQTPAIRLAAGNHIFRAQATDGELRYPPTANPSDPFPFAGPWDQPLPVGTPPDSAPGPKVAQNTPPQLVFPTDDAPDPTDPTKNPSPGLDPDAGTGQTTFTYTIIYKDADVYAGVQGNPPIWVRVYVDGQPTDMTPVNPNDKDFTDGNTFTATMKGFAAGTAHSYYFLANDGLDTARQPSLTDPNYPSKRYPGPEVKEPPGPAKSLVVSDVPNDQGGAVQGSFNPSDDDGGGADNVTEYRIYRSTSATMTNPVLAKIVAATKAGAYPFIDDTVPKNTDYWYVVRAWNGDPSPATSPPDPPSTTGGFESVDSNIAGPAKGLDNIAPAAPANLTAVNPGFGKEIDLSWTKSADDGGGAKDVAEYRIYRATTSGGYSALLKSVPGGTTSAKDQTTTDGQNYFYVVRSFDGVNESGNSNEAGPVQSTDNQPPVLSDFDPAPDARNVAVDATVSFTAVDTGAGVDPNSAKIVLKVGGKTLQGSLGQTPVTGGYRFTFTPDAPFNELDVVMVHVEVADLAVPTPRKVSQDYRFAVNAPPTYSIAGTIQYDDGTGTLSPLAGVTVYAGALSDQTDANGEYAVTGLTNGNYQVKAEKRGYAFTPLVAPVTIKDGNVSGIDFTAVAGYDIRGRITLKEGGKTKPGANVTVSNGVTQVLSAANGNYVIKDSPEGAYVVKASLPGYVFTPAQVGVALPGTGVGGGQDGVNFAGAPETFTIGGTVSTSDGGRLSGVLLTATRGGKAVASKRTDANGDYTLTDADLVAGKYTVTPTKDGYTFEPTKTDVTLGPSSENNDFVAFELFTQPYPAGLALLAIPVQPRDDSIINALGIAPDRIARWDPAGSRYVYANVKPDAEILKLAAGRGFFAELPAEKTIRVPGVVTRKTDPFTFEFQAGYNMAGNPYPVALPWSALGIAASGPVANFGFILRPGTRDYDLVSTVPELHGKREIPRGAGFWIHSDTATTLTTNAPGLLATTAARSEAEKADESNWIIPILARTPQAADLSSRAGILQAAQERPASFRVANPPAIPGGVDLYFTDRAAGQLACDIRGTAQAENSWDFAVRTDLRDTPVTVELPDLSAVPNRLRVTLVDVAANKRLYARTLKGYTYNSRRGGERLFRLEVAPDQGGHLVIGTAAVQPGRVGVVVSYSLSMRAAVSIEVRNISGRRVATLVRGKELEAGRNRAVWNLQADGGTLVPAGTYLVVVEAVAEDGQRARALQTVSVAR